MQGLCKLCGRDSCLEDSHLIPAAVYRLLRSSISVNPNPVFITSQGAVQTSRQAKTYLLCRNCEELLNSEGESQVLPLLAREDKTFPLYDLLLKGSPDLITEKSRLMRLLAINRFQLNPLLILHLGYFGKPPCIIGMEAKQKIK
jgi:hypothetical protein